MLSLELSDAAMRSPLTPRLPGLWFRSVTRTLSLPQWRHAPPQSSAREGYQQEGETAA